MILLVLIVTAIVVGGGGAFVAAVRSMGRGPTGCEILHARLDELQLRRQQLLMEHELAPFRLGSGTDDPPVARGDYP